MIIKKVILRNWKNFQNVEVELSERTFVVGANASGKSNLLDAFRFMRDIVKESGGLQYAVKEREGVSKLRCLSARTDNKIALEFHIGDSGEENEAKWKYHLTFKHTGGGIFENEAQITEEKVWLLGKGWILNRNSESHNNDKEILKFTNLEQVSANVEFREVYHFFRDLQYLHIVPQLVRDADSFFLASNKEDFYGRNILDRMSKTPKSTRDAYLRRINEVLQVAVPQLSELNFIDKKEDPNGIPHLEARYKHWRPRGAKQTERQFSDGTLRIIGFMWALLDGTETILLEEPELYLHSEIVKQLAEFISKMQKRRNKTRQVIITSHSFDLLNTPTISPSEILVLETTDSGTSVKRGSDINIINDYISSGFTPAEAVLPHVAPKDAKKIGQLAFKFE